MRIACARVLLQSGNPRHLHRCGQNAFAQGGDLLHPREQRRGYGKLRTITHLDQNDNKSSISQVFSQAPGTSGQKTGADVFWNWSQFVTSPAHYIDFEELPKWQLRFTNHRRRRQPSSSAPPVASNAQVDGSGVTV